MGKHRRYFDIRSVILCLIAATGLVFLGASSKRIMNELQVTGRSYFYGYAALYDTAEVWMDENTATISLARGASIPDVDEMCGTSIFMPAFDGVNTLEQIYGTIEVPHNEKKTDSSIYIDTCLFHLHCAPSTSDTGHFIFHLWYIVTNDDSSLTSNRDSSNAVGSATGTACKSGTLEFTGIRIRKLGTRIVFRLFRDPTTVGDTYEHDVFTGLAGIHYKVRNFGSKSIAD